MARSKCGKADRTGRSNTDYYTTIRKFVVDNDAWRNLTSTAQALYVTLRFEWRGTKNNNNGRLRLSVRQAAAAMGIDPNTAARAFRDLQAKGFIVVKEPGALGVAGMGKGPAYEITEIACPPAPVPRNLFTLWKEGADFPVQSHPVHNAEGRNGRRIPSIKQRRSRLGNEDKSAAEAHESGPARLQNRDVRAEKALSSVIEFKTSLITRGRGAGTPPDLRSGVDLHLCPLLRRA